MSGMVNHYQNEEYTNFWGVDFWFKLKGIFGGHTGAPDQVLRL